MQEVAGTEEREGEEKSRQWGKAIDEEESRRRAEEGQRRRRIEGAGGTSSFMMLTGYKKQAGC